MADVSRELVFCFDVGQGSANLIQYAPDHFAIVDLGPSQSPHGSPLVNMFRWVGETYGAAIVSTLVISHAHKDHWSGGLALISFMRDRVLNANAVKELPLKLRNVVIPYHKPIDELFTDPPEEMNSLLLFLDEITKVWPDCRFLPRVVPNDGLQVPLDLAVGGGGLSLVYPTEVVTSQGNETNAMSGIVVFVSGITGEKFVFSGDAPLSAWHDIEQRFSGSDDPLPWGVKLFAVPHHGGRIWPGRRYGTESEGEYSQRISEQLDVFFTTFLRVENAYVSVGSDNPYSHPHGTVVDALRRANANILCSQITPACLACDKDSSHLDNIRSVTLHGIEKLPPDEVMLMDGLDTLPGLASKERVKTKGGPKHVGCASTVVAVVTDGEATRILRTNTHALVVGRLFDEGAEPRCRPSPATRT